MSILLFITYIYMCVRVRACVCVCVCVSRNHTANLASHHLKDEEGKDKQFNDFIEYFLK